MADLILGAGVSGMAAGIKTGHPIYEATNQHGGICRSFIKDGFEFSNGGPHWIFGSGEGLEFIKSLVKLKSYERKAKVSYMNCSFPYPIQSFAQQETEVKSGTLKAWMHERFSLELCNMFFDPFNMAYTCGLYEDIVQDDEFKSPPAGDKGHVVTFYDPVEGLTSLIDKMALKCNIHYEQRAVKIDTEKKIVYFKSGEWAKYEKLISTIPLNQMMLLCGQTGYNLPYTSVFVLSLGAEKAENTPTEHWAYTPFTKCGFYRVGFSSNVDENKAPPGKVCLSVERPFPPGITFDDLDVDFIKKEIISELQNWRFIGNVITEDISFVPIAYTWLYLISKDDRAKALAWLKEHDITSIGRYGAHKFGGMVESIKAGLNVG